MNAAHFHLITNHVPVVGAPIALALLLAGLVRRREELVKAALVLTVLLSLIVLPVKMSGDRTEDLVESLDGVNVAAIHPHEERGEAAAIALLVAGGLALATLALPAILAAAGRGRPRWLPPQRPLGILSAGALAVSMGLLFSTAWLGGRIRHIEIDLQPGNSVETGER